MTHYKKIAGNEEQYVSSFEDIASQYTQTQLKIIAAKLPLNVRAVLEERSTKYQEINSFNNKISDSVRTEKKKEVPGTSEVLLKNDRTKQLTKPVIIPSAIDTSKKKKIMTKKNITTEETQRTIQPEYSEEENDVLQDIPLEELPEIKDIPQEEYMPEVDFDEMLENEDSEDEEEVIENIQPTKRGRGRPRKNITEPIDDQPKRKRGRPKKIMQEELEGEEETVLPGFKEDEDETILPGFDDVEDTVLPGIENEEDDDFNDRTQPVDNISHQMANVNDTNEFDEFAKKENVEYPELDIDLIMNQNQKLVAFVGTSKNGTSFLVNNVAEILSMNGIDTAILDLTRNRNSYYIYTKNDEQLRNKSNYITNNLKAGTANGIQEHKNLTIYTSPLEEDENLQAVEPIVETLINHHTVIIMDCDFTTPMKYFKYAQEIYLVQSMDILTIQPLTAFVRQLLDKGMFEPSKARVVLNKFIKTREITENILIGGMSIYNDAGMTVRKELFDRRNVPSIVIPFNLKSYLRYLDGLVTCDISLKGYDKEFINSLKNLASMVYKGQETKKMGKYMPPSVKNNNSGFSPRINNTLNQMRKNY